MGKLREMACQLNQVQLVETLEKILSLMDPPKVGRTFGEMLEAEVKDPAERLRMMVAFDTANQIKKSGKRLDQLINVICWRNALGEPKELEISFKA